MTLFPSALRSDRPSTMGIPVRPLHGLWNLISRVLAHRRSFTTTTLSLVTSPGETTILERAEPQLRWTDPRRAPGGDFAASAIPNADLDRTAVPGRGESWDAVSDFALSYDGYGYWDDLPSLASRVLQGWTRRRSLPPTLDELRGCLFYEQRRWHHFGEEPTGRSAQYMWAIIEAIGALVIPTHPTTDHMSDPRRAIAPEAHVKLVPSPAMVLRPLPSPPLVMRPMPASAGRLVPVPAAEAHVRLVTAIEDGASAMSRHPSRNGAGGSSGHLSGNPADHPAMSRSVHDLKPMPSAEPLPKPPVIVRRSRRSVATSPNRPGGAVNAPRTPPDRWGASGSRWKLERAAGQPFEAEVTPMCHEFCADDAEYRAWLGSHPDGFVLHQARATPSKAPTLHRVGCSAIAPRPGTEARNPGPIRVCSQSVDTLKTWSVARGTGQPTACRRCCPLGAPQRVTPTD